ncbi:MAG: LPXTG cell wall anchor domain-containing protein [Ruminococcus sp.]|nr:LPXTG cell wall anchor domain-containing protein [Ruminococcus sp.]
MKKMFAMLAAVSMLTTLSVTAFAEDETSVSTTVVVTEEAAVTTEAVTELAQVGTEETTETETIAISGDSSDVITTVTEETTPDETQTEVVSTTTGAVTSEAAGLETTTETTVTEETATTTTTESAEETAKIMEELQKQIDNLIDEIQSGSNPDLLPDEENVEMLPDYSSDNILQLEDGTWIGTYHTYYVDEEGYTYQVVYYVKTDGTKDIFYVTYYDDFDHNDALVCSDNPFYDEFYVQFTTFYKTLENTSDYYVLYCATDAGVNPTMYVVVEMTDGNLVFYAISQDGIQQVDKIPTFEFDDDSKKPNDSAHPTAAVQKSTSSTPKTGDTATAPAVAIGLTLTAAGVVAFLNRKYK